MSESSIQHKRAAEGRTASCGVLTVSDSRTRESDGGGDLVAELLVGAGHSVTGREIVPDDPAEIGRVLGHWLRDPEIEAIFTTGGTGISRRDSTVEVVTRFLDARLDGFGELFRMLSYQEVGSAAMLSRAVAGLAQGKLIFAMPGSVAGVRLAMEKLIVPELPHLVWERSR